MNILITGGASGLGEAITNHLSRDLNNTVYFTFCSSKEKADKIMSLFSNSKSIYCDFNDMGSVNSLCELIPDLKLDVLINNAYTGQFTTKHFHKISPDTFSEDFNLNIIPTIMIAQSSIAYFKKMKQGKIITILTSSLLNTPPIGASSYVANKAYLQSLSKSWAIENIKFNITANTVSPSLMQTKLTSDIDNRIIEQIIKEHPLKKILSTSEVTEAVSFLTKASQQINGLDLVINAGNNIK